MPRRVLELERANAYYVSFSHEINARSAFRKPNDVRVHVLFEAVWCLREGFVVSFSLWWLTFQMKSFIFCVLSTLFLFFISALSSRNYFIFTNDFYYSIITWAYYKTAKSDWISADMELKVMLDNNLAISKVKKKRKISSFFWNSKKYKTTCKWKLWN